MMRSTSSEKNSETNVIADAIVNMPTIFAATLESRRLMSPNHVVVAMVTTKSRDSNGSPSLAPGLDGPWAPGGVDGGAWAWRVVEHAATASTSATTRAAPRATDMLIGPSSPSVPSVPLPEALSSRRHTARPSHMPAHPRVRGGLGRSLSRSPRDAQH